VVTLWFSDNFEPLSQRSSRVSYVPSSDSPHVTRDSPHLSVYPGLTSGRGRGTWGGPVSIAWSYQSLHSFSSLGSLYELLQTPAPGIRRTVYDQLHCFLDASRGSGHRTIPHSCTVLTTSLGHQHSTKELSSDDSTTARVLFLTTRGSMGS